MSPSARLRTALALFEAGVDMQRQKLRRQDPEADAATIERRVGEWLRHRDPDQDYGRPIEWPRR